MTAQPVIHDSNPIIKAWKNNQGLTVLAVFSAFLIISSSLGLLFDSRSTEFLGTPTWSKTFKFSVSTLLYSLSLIWILGLANNKIAIKAGGFLGWVLGFELVLIAIQGARATPMHFNYSTVFNGVLWATMTVGIFAMLLAFLVITFQIWRTLKLEPLLAWAIRLGLLVTVIGLVQGLFMPVPTSAQSKALETGQTLDILGAHTIGNPALIPDANVGLPLVGWSTEYGDLRIGHFIGIHALQLIPLLGLWLSKRRLPVFHGLALLSIGVFAYLGLVLLVTWQALRGQPLLRPDEQTLFALVGLILAALCSSLIVMFHAKGRA
jgi:hypothetical protein